MKRLFILFILSVVIQTVVFSQSSELGLGWAQNTINGVVFRKNSVVTNQQTQYVAWYNAEGIVMLAKRKTGSTNWIVKSTQHKGNTNDAHRSISIMVDGNDYIHLSWDHHGNQINYCKSVAPGSLEVGDKILMTGYGEHNVTYPEFHKMPNGDLIFFYRSGASGRGDLVLNHYNLKEQVWTRIHDILIDGEGERNAYWQACVDAQGTIHISWVWREEGDVASNHDMCYAKSSDIGKTWQKSSGEKLEIPFSLENAEYAAHIPQKSDLINQTSMFADSEGNPFIATYFTPKGDITPQYHVIYKMYNKWIIQQVSQRNKPFSLSGGGTKKLDLSRPQIVVSETMNQKKAFLIFRDVERGNKVSISMSTGPELKIWKTIDITDFSVGDWEPSYDTELWKTQNKLHIYVQKMGQGDGEKLEKMKPQPVYILEIPTN